MYAHVERDPSACRDPTMPARPARARSGPPDADCDWRLAGGAWQVDSSTGEATRRSRTEAFVERVAAHQHAVLSTPARPPCRQRIAVESGDGVTLSADWTDDWLEAQLSLESSRRRGSHFRHVHTYGSEFASRVDCARFSPSTGGARREARLAHKTVSTTCHLCVVC